MRVLLILLLVILAGCNSEDQESKLILKVLEDQRQAWNKGNLEGYMQGYVQSDSLVFIGKSGPKYGWQTTLDNYKKGYPDKEAMGFLTFEIKKVKLIGSDHAFVVGGWHLKRSRDEPQGYFTLLMEKVNGKWKVIADHSS